MATLWHILKPEDKLKLAMLYRDIAGFDFIPPNSPDPVIQCETKTESLEEIDKLMRQKPRGRAYG